MLDTQDAMAYWVWSLFEKADIKETNVQK